MSTNASAVGETMTLQPRNESYALAIGWIYTREMKVGPGVGRRLPEDFQGGTLLFKGRSKLERVTGLEDNDTWQHTKQCCVCEKILGVLQPERKKSDARECTTKPLASRTLQVVTRTVRMLQEPR
jgi:hypothetical protein